MTVDLNVLAGHRNALFLAEAIGWLHDYRKCSEQHLQAQAPGRQTQALPRAELSNRQPNLQNISLALPTVQSSARTVTNLLDDRTWSQDTLGQFLSRCHNTAHFDKQEPVGGEQNYPGTQISSAFGFEKPVGINLTTGLWALPWSTLATLASDRQDLREKISTLFAQTVADSRRPINEVDLWSWGSLVGALYKSALAGSLLTGIVPSSAQDLRWRLLSVRVDGLGYISNVARVPDLLARQKLLSDALDQVRTLLEVEYPLGSEVYRDQDGSLFIVPDVPDLLEIPDDQGTTLEARIIRTFTGKVESDLLPLVTLEQSSWWGQDPNWSKNATTTNDKLPDVKGMLTRPVATQADVRFIETSWQGKAGNWELCPVCRLRPKREEDEVCETCEKRRRSRIETWEQNPAQTIWMDEIADANDRVALIVGKFGLDGWLSGDLVQTMLVRAVENAPEQCTPKNPSPARLRRVWETCQRFWTETVEQQILKKLSPRTRWELIPALASAVPQGIALDGTLNGQPISVFRIGDRLLTISFVAQPQGGNLIIGWKENGRKERTTVAVTPQAIGQDGLAKYQSYTPYLTLLASPDQFLALVPAADALAIAEKIRAAYVEQFGKVQNRLPLFLGLVFFQRKMPLMAVMDTARRMLAGEFANGEWRIAKCEDKYERRNGQDVLIERTLVFENQCEIKVKTVMGDDETPDVWYPYFELVGTPAAHHTHRFECDGAWWVHVKTLQAGETVRVIPSRFAYLFLESTAQRFRFDPQQDVLLLDELPRLMKMWGALKECDITDTGLRNVQALLESKSAAWKNPGDELEHLTETTLKRAGLLNAVTVDDVLGGRFARCLELYLHILKLRLKLRLKEA